MSHSRCCQLVCLLVTFTLTACHQQHFEHEPPEWLMGLQQLREDGQPAVTASLQAARQQHSASPQIPPEGQLLRPKTLLPVASAHLAAVQNTASHGVTLGSVSRAYGVTETQLRRMMEQDHGLRVSHQGLLVWTCSNSHIHDAVYAEVSAGVGSADATADDDSVTDRTAAAEDAASVMTASTVAAASVADAGMPWLADGLFTAVLPPSLAQVGAVGQLSNDQAQAWTSAPAPAASNFAILQSTSASHEAPNKDRPQAWTVTTTVASEPTAPVVVQQPGPQPLPQQAFRLHNRQPGSVKHAIFLDFRGCTITNSYWNKATNKPVITTQPFDLDGDPSTFSVQEQGAIVSVWQAVVQDFAAWAVDVTTEDPGQDALVRSHADDVEYGMHVCVGGSSATTVGGLSGGLAFTGAWGQLGPGLQPVLVFPEQLGKGHARAVADSISHEVGHTFGLAHFGGSGSAPYNDGSGPWGPLLGLPYGRVLSQWSTGTAVTGRMQDDLHLIAQQLPPMADDHGDSAAAATPLCEATQLQGATRSAPTVGGAHTQGTPGVTCKWLKSRAQEASSGGGAGGYVLRAIVRGVISNSSDSDWFRVHVSRPGALHVKLQLPSSATGYGVNNLLVAVVVTGSDGTVLTAVKAESGSETVLQASATVAAAGMVHVSVVPAGVPGVSSYGSLGDYVLSVTLPAHPPAQQAHETVAVPGLAAQPVPATTSTRQGCDQCAPHAGCAPHTGRGSAGAQHCSSCPASQGFVFVVANSLTGADSVSEAAHAAAGISSSSSCQYQEVKPLSFSTKTCSTAMAGAIVLLNFTVSKPPACYEGSIIAAAPATELLQSCPCRQSPKRTAHKLPTPQPGTPVQADGSFTCQGGVYAYGWQVPSTAGCYRLSIHMADGSTVLTVLRVVVVDTTVSTQSTSV